MASFELQRRGGHSVLYLSRGTQAIRVPADAKACDVSQAISGLPSGSYDRRRRAIDKLHAAGIVAS